MRGYISMEKHTKGEREAAGSQPGISYLWVGSFFHCRLVE